MSDSSKQITVRDDGVEVERTIKDGSAATVVAYRFTALTSMPLIAHIEENIPPEDRIEMLEFHPSHLPDEWAIGDGTVQFDVTVSPDETQMVMFGMDATDDEPLGRDEPKISRPDTASGNSSDSNGGATPTPDAIQRSPDDSPPVLNTGTKKVSDGGETSTDPNSNDVLDLPEPNADDSDAAAEDSIPSPDADGDTVTPEDNMEDREELSDAATTPEPAVDIERAEETGDVDSSTGDPIGDDLGAVDEAEADRGIEDEAEEDTAPVADESLVGTLVAELRAGNASDEELDALRSELGVGRADEVRFRHVQSRMDDFEAYVDALEGIINEHGTASAFVDGIERQVSDIHDELSSVRSEVRAVEDGLESAADDRENLADEVAELDDTVTEVTDDLAQLHELVETVDDRTETIEEALHEELATIREEQAEQVERIETELEAEREQRNAQVDSLREDVDSFDEVRRTLLDAFGERVDPTSDDETEDGEDAS